MGMTAHYRQISEFEFNSFKRSPEKAYHLCFGESNDVMAALSAFHAMASDHLRRTQEIQAKYRPTGIYERLAEVKFNPERLSLADQAIFEEQRVAIEAVHQPSTPPDEKELSIDKAWQAIHYLLVGRAEGGEPPLADVVFGGVELPDRENYTAGSPLRMLSPSHVRTIAAELAAIPAERLLKRASIADMAEKGIYSVSDDEPSERDYIGHYYGLLRDFYADAANKGNAMLLYIV